jgi:hypothetical protein
MTQKNSHRSARGREREKEKGQENQISIIPPFIHDAAAPFTILFTETKRADPVTMPNTFSTKKTTTKIICLNLNVTIVVALGVAVMLASEIIHGLLFTTELIVEVMAMNSPDITIEPSEERKTIYNAAELPTKETVSNNSRDCWVTWDHRRKLLMGQWFENDLPIMATAVHGKRREGGAEIPIVYVILTQFFLKNENQPKEWMCLYKSLDNNNETLQRLAGIAPRHPRKARDNIAVTCDNDSSQLLFGIRPVHDNAAAAAVATNITSANSTSSFQYYDIQLPLECSGLEKKELSERSSFQNSKVGACVRFKGDNDRQQIPQWIEYHHLLGVDHFWVYMNEPYNMTNLFNLPYVTYMPFDVTWSDFPQYMLKYFSRTKELPHMQWYLSQEPVQTSCLYTAKQHGLDWIITTDVDEYVHVKQYENYTMPHNRERSTLKHLQPLKSFLKKYNKTEYGCMAMNSIPYGINAFMEHPDSPNEYMIDKVWRKKKSLDDYRFRRCKQIYNVAGVWSVGVHYCHNVEKGLKTVSMQPDKDGIYIQHYKLAHKGVSGSGEHRMIGSPDMLLKDSSLRDSYREALDTAMKQLHGQDTGALTETITKSIQI